MLFLCYFESEIGYSPLIVQKFIQKLYYRM